MARKTIKVSYLLGGYAQLLQFVESHTAEITAGGLDPAPLAASLAARGEEIAALDAAQENLKTALRNATLALQASVGANYERWSSDVDLLRGALVTISPGARQLTALRKGIIRPHGRKPSPSGKR